MHEKGARFAFVAHLRLMHESGPLGVSGAELPGELSIKLLECKMGFKASASQVEVRSLIFVIDLWVLGFDESRGWRFFGFGSGGWVSLIVGYDRSLFFWRKERRILMRRF